MWNRSFWRDALERAIKTAAQSALLTIGAEQVNAFNADYKVVLGMALGGAIVSVLTSLTSVKVGNEGTASLVK